MYLIRQIPYSQAYFFSDLTVPIVCLSGQRQTNKQTNPSPSELNFIFPVKKISKSKRSYLLANPSYHFTHIRALKRPERIPTFLTLHVNHNTSNYVRIALLDPQFAGKKSRPVK